MRAACCLLLLTLCAAVTSAQRCPVEYPDQTVDDIRRGAKPYLLGGAIKPGDEARAYYHSCKFWPREAAVCSQQQQDSLLQDYLTQPGWEGLLTFSPCQLWQHIRGRTLYIVGDSQVGWPAMLAGSRAGAAAAAAAVASSCSVAGSGHRL